MLQCHGGIFIMTHIVRDLNAKYNPDLMVYLFDPISVWPQIYQEGLLEDNTELHAGEGETAMMLSIAPETVQMDKALDFVPDVPRSYLSYGCLLRYCPDGVWGKATLGTAEKGERMLERTAELAAEQMEKAFAFMADKKPLNYSNF